MTPSSTSAIRRDMKESHLLLISLALCAFAIISPVVSNSCPHLVHNRDRRSPLILDNYDVNLRDKHAINSIRHNPIFQNGFEDPETARLEYIKSQILRKLGLKHVPKVHSKPIDIAAYLNLFELQQQKHQEDVYSDQSSNSLSAAEEEESDKIFVIPYMSTSTTATFNLSLNPHTTNTDSVRKIALYLKRQLNVDEPNYSKKSIIMKQTTKIGGFAQKVLGNVRPQPLPPLPDHDKAEDGMALRWLEYDLTTVLKDQLSKKKPVTVDGNTPIYSAFIVIDLEEGHTRKKRSVDCVAGANTACCREPFYVNFTHIGWDNWILQPAGYSANYCKGQCDISNARYHHTTVVRQYPSTIRLCCSPREMSHISLLYMDEDGFVYQKILQNMTVESCDCA